MKFHSKFQADCLRMHETTNTLITGAGRSRRRTGIGRRGCPACVQKSGHIYLFEIIELNSLIYSMNFGNNAENNQKMKGKT